VCQIVALLEMAPSTVSKHMSILRQAGLVESRKVARWVHYSLPDRKAPRIVRDAIAFAFEHVEGSEKIAHDAVRLGKIVRMRLEDLCAGRCK
jgi:ArsR family transcriptional regulator